MSELENKLKEEVDRFKEWREGKDFRLSTFSTGPNRCRRCGLEKSQLWVLSHAPSLRFDEIDFGVAAQPITSENVCRDCLKDHEIAELLAPVVIFCLTSLVAQPAPDGKDVLTGDIARIAWRTLGRIWKFVGMGLSYPLEHAKPAYAQLTGFTAYRRRRSISMPLPQI